MEADDSGNISELSVIESDASESLHLSRLCISLTDHMHQKNTKIKAYPP